jgi:hypothetical protein
MKLAAAIVFLALTFAKTCQAQDDDTPFPPPHEMSVALFNHKDFSGWTFCMKGGADPQKTWSVTTNGTIHCTGTPIGYIRTTQVYSNYFLTVVWRFVKIAPQADNTGILLHIQPPDKVWPKCVQVQGKHDHQGDLFVMEGAECKEHKGMDKNTPVPLQGDSVEVPVGEWNKSETICVNNKVECFMNSKFVNEISGCTINSGCIGIQSEGGDIEIRSIDYCPLKY